MGYALDSLRLDPFPRAAFLVYSVCSSSPFTSGCFQFATAHIAEILSFASGVYSKRAFSIDLLGTPANGKSFSSPGDFIGER